MGSEQWNGLRPWEERGGNLLEEEDATHGNGKGSANTTPFNKEATRWLGIWLDVEKGFSCLVLSVTLSLCRAEGRRERVG